MSKKENSRNKNKKEHFNVPSDYFQKSAADIFNKIEWEEEMKPYALLLQLKGKHGFTVPENYFQKAELLLENLEFEKLITIPKINPFQIPQNYFEEKGKIISFELLENENAETPLLNTLAKQNNFKLQESYFEKNELEIKRLLEVKKSAKIFNLSFSKIAFAAAAVLVITIGLWVYNIYNKSEDIEDCGTLACIEKRELLKSKQFESLDDEDLYELVNPNNLEQGLNKTNLNQLNKKDSGTKNSVSDDVLDEI